ncbi:hypothetical protein LSAT2_006136 [Lamellibrachia satsuma]|nr:hypothetical protein LSAT2_006136 [Lamellibrachia satsuma]
MVKLSKLERRNKVTSQSRDGNQLYSGIAALPGSGALFSMNFIISGEILFSAAAAEAFNQLWYSNYTPWGAKSERMLLPSVAASVGMAVIYKAIIHYYWRPRFISDLWVLTTWIGTLVLCLEASVTLWAQTTISSFLIDVVHTFLVTYIILVVIFLVRLINHAEYPDTLRQEHDDRPGTATPLPVPLAPLQGVISSDSTQVMRSTSNQLLLTSQNNAVCWRSCTSVPPAAGFCDLYSTTAQGEVCMQP